MVLLLLLLLSIKEFSSVCGDLSGIIIFSLLKRIKCSKTIGKTKFYFILHSLQLENWREFLLTNLPVKLFCLKRNSVAFNWLIIFSMNDHFISTVTVITGSVKWKKSIIFNNGFFLFFSQNDLKNNHFWRKKTSCRCIYLFDGWNKIFVANE